MPFPFHTIELADGSNPNQSDKLVGGLLLSVANASGSGSVTTAVSFPAGSLPANYAVFVDAGQAEGEIRRIVLTIYYVRGFLG